MVTGYTDSVGSDAYNLRLSERRAQTVRDALVAGGVASTRITAKGMGKSNPVASNETAWRAARRIVGWRSKRSSRRHGYAHSATGRRRRAKRPRRSND